MYETHLSLPGRRQGKVRDVYDLPPGALSARLRGVLAGAPAILIVATDRISAFDVVMPTPIPGKGRILTDLSERWFRFIEERGLARTHLLSCDVEDAPGLSPADRAALAGRVTIARKAAVVPIECVARGYLAGSGWNEYRDTGAVCGVRLPEGLRPADSLMDRVGGPIFTPATKASAGHDENIDFRRACEIAGEATMRALRDATLAIYYAAHRHAMSRGVILADTKFEFGFPLDARGEPDAGAGPMLVDEALTPDSSRYWPRETWKPGEIEQVSFDKQFLREHLLRLVAEGRWAKSPPGPEIPEEVARRTLEKYEQARRLLFPERPNSAA